MNRQPLLSDQDDYLISSESSSALAVLASAQEFKNFICPITQQVMMDPYLTKYGHSFEKTAIEKWINGSHNCPLTKQPLELNQIFPNRNLKSQIEEQLGKHKLAHKMNPPPVRPTEVKATPPPQPPQPRELSSPGTSAFQFAPPPQERMVETTITETIPNRCRERGEACLDSYTDLAKFFFLCGACEWHCSDGNGCDDCLFQLCGCFLSGLGTAVGCPPATAVCCFLGTCGIFCCNDRQVTRTERVPESQRQYR